MEKIYEYVQRIEEKTRDLIFRTQNVPQLFENINLANILKEVFYLFTSRVARQKILVDIDYASLNFSIEADIARLKSAFMNLIINAIDAMPNGGILTIEGNKKDSGKGISKQNLNEVWKAFYSTKKYGTGMGLPICKSIIEFHHHGEIEIESKEGIGTTVYIKIPFRNKD